MFFPSPSTCKMVKDAHNHVMINIIGLSQTSRDILEDGDVPIFPVVLITPTRKVYLKATCLSKVGIIVSTFCVEVNTICILP